MRCVSISLAGGCGGHQPASRVDWLDQLPIPLLLALPCSHVKRNAIEMSLLRRRERGGEEVSEGAKCPLLFTGVYLSHPQPQSRLAAGSRSKQFDDRIVSNASMRLQATVAVFLSVIALSACIPVEGA